MFHFPMSVLSSLFSAHKLMAQGGGLAADFVTQTFTVTCLPSPRGSICRFPFSNWLCQQNCCDATWWKKQKIHWFSICQILSIPLLYVFPGRTQANDSGGFGCPLKTNQLADS